MVARSVVRRRRGSLDSHHSRSHYRSRGRPHQRPHSLYHRRSTQRWPSLRCQWPNPRCQRLSPRCQRLNPRCRWPSPRAAWGFTRSPVAGRSWKAGAEIGAPHPKERKGGLWGTFARGRSCKARSGRPKPPCTGAWPTGRSWKARSGPLHSRGTYNDGRDVSQGRR